MEPREFTCTACHRDIIAFGYDPGGDLCAMCRWINENIEEREREALRRRLTGDGGPGRD